MYQTDRLLIRPFDDSDTLDVHNLWTDPRIDPSRTASTMQLLEDKIHAQSSLMFMVLRLQDSEEFVGMSTLSTDGEWGIMLRLEFWGVGLGREVAEWSLRCAFVELELSEVNLRVVESNERAWHLYINLGFIEIGRGQGIVQMIFPKEAWLEAQVKECKNPPVQKYIFDRVCRQTPISFNVIQSVF